MSHPLLTPTLDRPLTPLAGEVVLGVIDRVPVYSTAGLYVRWCAPLVRHVPSVRVGEAERSLSSWEGEEFQEGFPGEGSDLFVQIGAELQALVWMPLAGRSAEVYNLYTRKYVRVPVVAHGRAWMPGEASIAAARAVGVAPNRVKSPTDARWLSYVVYLTETPAYAFPKFEQGHNG